MTKKIILGLMVTLLIGCQPTKDKTPELSINFEKITLDNGLDVVFHIDRSDPVVAVELMAQ